MSLWTDEERDLSNRYYDLAFKMIRAEPLLQQADSAINVLLDGQGGATLAIYPMLYEVTLADLEFSESMPEDWFAAWWRNGRGA